MDFKQAVITCVKDKYCNFTGRAPRSEYWWFILFSLIAGVAVTIIGSLISPEVLTGLSALLWLGLLLPSLGATARRLHDSDHSGWWQLLFLVPFGGIVILIFCLIPGTPGTNRFGPNPLGDSGQGGGGYAGGGETLGYDRPPQGAGGRASERFSLDK